TGAPRSSRRSPFPVIPHALRSPTVDPRHPDRFPERHLGLDAPEAAALLETLGFDSLDTFGDAVVPDAIRFDGRLELPPALSERELLDRARQLADRNRVYRSYLGMGYYGTVTPPV